MKSLYSLVILLCFWGKLLAQVGIGTITPNPNAVLELKSPGNNQGFLVPRLTSSQRAAISLTTQDNGLMVYDSDDQKFYYWQNSLWLPIRSGTDITLEAGAGIAITDNTISAIPDGDGNATNEIQNLQLNGNTLSITNNASATPIDLAPFSGTNTDNQTLTFNAATGQLSISGGNNVTVSATGAAGGILSGTFPDPGLNTSSGNTLLGILNNASTTASLSANRLAGSVVLDTEVPTASDISGTFSAGLAINNNAVTTAKINDGAVTNAKIPNAEITASKIAPSATAGQVLTTVAGTTAWANLPPLSGGTVTSITAGAGLSGGTITASGTIAIANTAVAPGSYGSATQIPAFTVDQQGRLTAAQNVTISAGGGEGLGETLALDNDAKGQDAVNFNSISINNTKPVSGSGALNVNGAHFVSFSPFSDGYVVQPQDYVLISETGKPATIDLPKAQENRGRILIIRSTGTSLSNAVTVRSTEGIDGAATSEPLYLNGNISDNVAYSLTLISNGVIWLTINRAIADSRFKG